jgi:hypothetical protein
MATINKQYSFIWYGICTDTSQLGGGCSLFNLGSGAGPEANKIDTVWQIDGSGDAQAFVNGATGPQPFDSLECGYAYYIKLKDAETYDCEIPHAQLSSYGENAPAEFRITSDCTAGDSGPVAGFKIDATPINETLIQGYTQADTTGNAFEHTTIISEATDIKKVSITTNNNAHLQYTTGTSWANLTGTIELSDNFTSLKLRTRTGYSTQKTSTLTFTATTTSDMNTSPLTLTYTTDVTPLTLTLSANMSESIEIGSSGEPNKFTITHSGLNDIDITLTDDTNYHVSKVQGSDYGASVNFSTSDLSVSPVDLYVKFVGSKSESPQSTTINASGTPKNAGASPKTADQRTLTSNVVPVPTASLSVAIDNTITTTGAVKITPTFTNTNGYNATSYRYRINLPSGTDGSWTTVGNFDNQAISIGDSFNAAGDYTIDLQILDSGGSSISQATHVTNKPCNIPAYTADITIADINFNTIDRDDLPSEQIITPTITNVADQTAWTIDTNESNDDLAVEKTSNNKLKCTLNDGGGSVPRDVNANNVVTIAINGTKWHRVLQATAGDTTFTPATLEVTDTCTITGKITDALKFAWLGSPTDPYRDDYDLNDAVNESNTAVQFEKDNVNVTSATLTGTNWQIKIGDGTWTSNASTINDALKNDTDGTSPELQFRYNKTDVSITDAIGSFTLAGTATNGESNPSNLVINLRATVKKAEAIFNLGTQNPLNIESGASNLNNGALTFGLLNATLAYTTDQASSGDFKEISLDNGQDISGTTVYTLTYKLADEDTVATGLSSEELTFTSTADAENGFGADRTSTKVIKVTLTGSVSAKEATASVTSNPTPINVTANASTGNTGTAEITVSNATLVAPNASQGDFTDVALSGPSSGVYTLTYKLPTNTVKANASTTFNIVANAAANSEFAGSSSTKNVPITLTGSVSPKVATASAGEVTGIAGTIGTDWTDQEGTFDVTVANATIDNISGPVDVNTSLFNIKSNTASGSVYTYKYSLDAEETSTEYGNKNTTYNITVKPAANSAFATKSTGETYTLPVTLSASITAGTATLTVDDSSAIDRGTITQSATESSKTISVTGADYLDKITVAVTGGAFQVSSDNTNWNSTSVDINSPTLSSKIYIKLNSDAEAGNADSTIKISGIHNSLKASADPAEITINCSATIEADGGGGDDCCPTGENAKRTLVLGEANLGMKVDKVVPTIDTGYVCWEATTTALGVGAGTTYYINNGSSVSSTSVLGQVNIMLANGIDDVIDKTITYVHGDGTCYVATAVEFDSPLSGSGVPPNTIEFKLVTDDGGDDGEEDCCPTGENAKQTLVLGEANLGMKVDKVVPTIDTGYVCWEATTTALGVGAGTTYYINNGSSVSSTSVLGQVNIMLANGIDDVIDKTITYVHGDGTCYVATAVEFDSPLSGSGVPPNTIEFKLKV